MSPEQLRLATIGAAFGSCPFDVDRRLSRRHRLDDERRAIEANGEFAEPEWRALTSSDGVRCFVAAQGAEAP